VVADMESRTYELDGKKKKFNSVGFRRRVETYCKANKITKAKFEQLLEEKINWDKETIHKWIYGKNNPNDLEVVKSLANELGISDYIQLLDDVEDEKMKQLTDRQVTAVKKIYDSCVWFLNEFYNSDGFNDLWHKLVAEGVENPESAITEYVDNLHKKVNLIADQEFFDLRDTDIYNELCEFISDELEEIYYGKVSYAYKFEAIASGQQNTAEDYGNAMDKLNKIIEKYV
jgi:transcriptional regulator with XRE-family HTH domain